MKIVILTGAGISAESGISTFRNNGFWDKYNVEEIATPEGLARNFEVAQGFFDELRQMSDNARPNPAHIALGELEKHHEVYLITQNVDNLHEKGGSTDVIHMHGDIHKALCSVCSHQWTADGGLLFTHCPKCGSNRVRPDIVLFTEMPHHMDEIMNKLFEADIFLAIGTSGQVYPAADFVNIASQTGALCIEVNIDGTEISSSFHENLVGPASVLVPEIVKHLCGE